MIELGNSPEVMSNGHGTGNLSGLGLHRTAGDGPGQGHGIDRLLGMNMTSIEPGSATFDLKTRVEHFNALGIVHGGIAASLLDSAMACAIHSTLNAGDGFVTVELKVNYIRAVGTEGETLTARGTVIHVGRSTAVADGQIRNDDGHLVAHATTTCLIRREI